MSNGQRGRINFPGAGPTCGWQVRPARETDIEALVVLRRAMFESIGCHDLVSLDRMAEASARYFAASLPRGEFRAWVAEADGEIVASGGLVIHTIPPTTYNLAGREGYIMNMYTRPAWRRQGIGTAILQVILEYLRAQGIPMVSLHAAPEGQPLYERAGFEPSNEVRLRLEPSPMKDWRNPNEGRTIS
jgi:GNAT superfamily N-acetyltransferase